MGRQPADTTLNVLQGTRDNSPSRVQHKVIPHTEPGNEINFRRKRQFTDAGLDGSEVGNIR